MQTLRKTPLTGFFGLAAAAFLVAAVVIGSHETESTPNAGLVGSLPAIGSYPSI